MQRCIQCGAAAPDDASFCPNCGHPFNKQSQQKKKRSFLASLLLLLGIRRDPQTGSLGCALVPATISVALVAIIILGVVLGPVLKVIPLFASGSTVTSTGVPSNATVTQGLLHASPTTSGGTGVTPTSSQGTSQCSNSTAGTGTNLTFTFPGAAPSPMCVTKNNGCYTISSTSPVGPNRVDYHFSVLGTLNSKLYTFMFVIGSIGPNGLQGYSGPGTYTGDGGIALIVGDYSKVTGPVSEWTTVMGTITVNGGETSGSVNDLLYTNANGTGQAVQVTGNWACSKLQRG